MIQYIFLFLLLLLVIGLIGIYSIRKTPYGLLDTKVALALKLITERPPGESVAKKRANMRALTEKYKQHIPIHRVDNQLIKTADHNIPIRIYSNHEATNLPILVFYHGGGWVVGDLETHDGICRLLAKSTKMIVVSVDYRLAPEHPYPVPLEDAYNALLWISKNGHSIGGNPQKIAVGGDSAGGNLAAAVALKARDENGPKISYQALIYPVTDLSKLTTQSYLNFKNGYFLTQAMMQEYINDYTPNATSRQEGYASPLLAKNVNDLPPTLVITAGFDPLRDEGEQYGERLKATGIKTTISRYKGTIHGFFGLKALGASGIKAIEEVGHHLTSAFR